MKKNKHKFVAKASGKKIHFMGIGGSGIGGVAMLASKMGYRVSGCDLESSTAYAKDVEVGHSKKHLKDVDLLVVTPAVFYQNDKNEELVEARKRGILMTWQEFLGKFLFKNKKVIAIAGTHGKSTTSALAGKLLEDAGFDPTVVVGARIEKWGGNARYGKGDYFVVEADEFYNNFLHYKPDILILNNIEFDHPDFFKNEKQVISSFKKFVKNVKPGGKIIANKTPLDIKPIKISKRFNLKLMGEHNQENARMVYMLGTFLGIDEKKIIKSIESFKGIGRRMQYLGKSETGFLVYDDYAHHPTAIKTTLKGVRQNYPYKKIWAVIEAHGFERTYKLLDKYRNVFSSMDGVIIGPIFKARDKVKHGLTPSSIAKISNHKNIYSCNSFEQIANLIKNNVKKNDIVIVMGAGKSYLWAKEIIKI